MEDRLSSLPKLIQFFQQKEQDARSKAVEHPQHNSSSAASARAIAAVQPSQRKNAAGYSRYDQEIFVKVREELVILLFLVTQSEVYQLILLENKTTSLMKHINS